MKKMTMFAAAIVAAATLASCAHKEQGYNATVVWNSAVPAQLREDVRQLTNDIDNGGDIDRYAGSDHFERLYSFSHK